MLPDQKRHAKSILRDAVRDYYGVDSSIVIRPQQADEKASLRGFSVFKETKNQPGTPNDLVALCTVAVNNEGDVSVPSGDADVSTIQTKFNMYIDLLSASMVSNLFVDVVTKLHGAGGIRPTGGIYFLLQDQVELFDSVVKAAQKAAAIGSTQVFMFTLRRDARTIDGIHTAVVKELKQFIASTTDVVSSETIGPTGLRTQVAAIQQQLSRLAKFEESLGGFALDVKTELNELCKTALTAQLVLAGRMTE